ncbi:MAG: ATP-binding protein [Hyphomonadaceae bacterium]
MSPEQIFATRRESSRNTTLEYKRDPPKDNKEFCKDVCSMANASGGTILFRIREAGCADALMELK